MSKRRGETPGDLPVIAPTKYQPQATKALGITIPPSVLAHADEGIE